MKKRIYSMGLSVLVLSGLQVEGQVHIARKEKATDRIEIRVSKAQLNRDIRELKDFRLKKDEFESAYAAGDETRLSILHTEFVVAMQREIEQSEKKTYSDRKEVSRSMKEISNSRRDEASNRMNSSISERERLRDLRGDRRDTRDDLRDARNDEKDLNQQIARTNKQILILDEFLAWQFDLSTGEDTKSAPEILLLKKFETTLQEDVIALRIEIVEDRRELWEDRREIREGKRDRREIREDKQERREQQY